MKRLLVVLSAMLLTVSLFGCSKAKEPDEPAETATSEQEQQPEEEPVEEVTEIEIEEGESTGGL